MRIATPSSLARANDRCAGDRVYRRVDCGRSARVAAIAGGAPGIRVLDRRRPSARRRRFRSDRRSCRRSESSCSTAPSRSASAGSTTTTITRRVTFSAARSPRNSPSRASSIGPSSSTRARPRTTPAPWSSKRRPRVFAAYCTATPGLTPSPRPRSQPGGTFRSAVIVTFKKWDDDALIRLVPDDRILVESDSPYLAPDPQPREAERTGVG